MGKKVGVSQEEKNLSYYKYFVQDLAPVPEEISISAVVPQGLFAHNIKEFTNLAAILPSVYEEEKDIF